MLVSGVKSDRGEEFAPRKTPGLTRRCAGEKSLCENRYKRAVQTDTPPPPTGMSGTGDAIHRFGSTIPTWLGWGNVERRAVYFYGGWEGAGKTRESPGKPSSHVFPRA